VARRLSRTRARTRVEKLVRQFAAELPEIKATRAVKEAQVEDKYLKPLFRALNWNTDNEGLSLHHEEFVVQATQWVDGSAKSPDYLLRLPDPDRPYRLRRHLFIEAKHPKYDLARDVRWIRQTYRYAHSTVSETDRRENWVRLALLTDFEEFRLFDCLDPEPLQLNTPEAYNKRVVPGFDLMFTQYVDDFDRLWDTFERDAVAAGSLLSLAVTAVSKRRARVSPDQRFLGDLERFRLAIAQGFERRSPGLSDRYLTAATQLVLDRIVFAKMLHDRGLETDHLSQALAGLPRADPSSTELYSHCQGVFEGPLNTLYNGRLFAQRDELEGLALDDQALRPILEELRPVRAPYTLAAMPVEIIGYAYEKFLGRVIERAEDGVRVVEKPEVRRNRGVFYTPRHIVENIVERTVGIALASCTTPEQVRRLKVLDPSCGSGSFLIVAYERIVRWYRAFFIAQVEGWTDARGRVQVPDAYQPLVRIALKKEGRWVRLTLRCRRDILLQNIFGVDIDDQAVEVSRFSLCMKALEDVTREEIHGERTLFHTRILPDLSRNIVVGNSLIATDLDPELPSPDWLAARPFDWAVGFPETMASGGFDCVIGNPPYDVIEKDRRKASWPHDVLLDYVKTSTALAPSLGRKKNLFRMFVVQGLRLTRPDGRFGMILPMSLLADLSTTGTRRYLIEGTRDLALDCFPQKDNAARRVFRDAKLSTVVTVGTRKGADEPAGDPAIDVQTFPWDGFDDSPRHCTVHPSELARLDSVKQPIPLADQATWALCARRHAHPAVVSLGDVDDFLLSRGEINQTIYREFITDESGGARLLKGAEIAPYVLQPPSQGRQEWFDEDLYVPSAKPKTAAKRRQVAGAPRIATQRITGVDDSRRLIALIMAPPAYFADSTNSIQSRGGDLAYLVALLNSELWQWRFRITSTNNNVQTNELDAMPYRALDSDSPGDAELGAQVVAQVALIERLHRELGGLRGADGLVVRRRIEAARRRVDELVYALYDLSPEDVGLIRRTLQVSGVHAEA